MKINRLFEIVYILLDKKLVTAKELSEYFEVSQRTIYRDIDTLSTAGIPIYTNKGKGGGISLVDDFVLNKSILSEQEQREILMSLQSLRMLKFPNIESVLNKLSTLFNKQAMDWIDVDFSHWGSDKGEEEKFNSLKTAILNRNIVVFDYFGSNGVKTKRTVEPIKLLFKGQSWYVYGFCRMKSDFRIFKITRVKNLSMLIETFIREAPKDIWSQYQGYNQKMIKLVLEIQADMAYRVYDEFDEGVISKKEDGSFTVNIAFPEDEWVYGYIMSFGDYAEVIQPKHIRETIRRKLQESLKKYI